MGFGVPIASNLKVGTGEVPRCTKGIGTDGWYRRMASGVPKGEKCDFASEGIFIEAEYNKRG